MNIAEIIKLENDRTTPDMYGHIHFIKEGNFYRAHDWSAWLMITHPLTENQAKLTIIAKKMKDGYIDAWVGFPLTSIEKFIPNDGSVVFAPINDTLIDVMITPTDDIITSTPEDVRKKVDEWKASLPLNEGKSQKRESREISEAQPRITRITDVITRVISLPLENMSPVDAYDFLRQLRKDIAAIY